MSMGLELQEQAGRLRNRGSIPSKGKRYSLLQSDPTGSGAYSAAYSMGTIMPSPGVKQLGL